MEFQYEMSEADERSDLECLFDPATHTAMSEIYADILARYEVRRAAAELKLTFPKPIPSDPIEEFFDEMVMIFRGTSIDQPTKEEIEPLQGDATETQKLPMCEGVRPQKTTLAGLQDLPLEILYDIGRLSLNPAFYLTCRKTTYVLDLERDEVKYMATMFSLNPNAFCKGCPDDYVEWLLQQPWISREHITDAYCWWLRKTVTAETRQYIRESRDYEADYKFRVPSKSRKVISQMHATTFTHPGKSVKRIFTFSRWKYCKPNDSYLDIFRVLVTCGYRCGLQLPIVSIDRMQSNVWRYDNPWMRNSFDTFINTEPQCSSSERRRVISLPSISDRSSKSITQKPISTTQSGAGSREDTVKFLAASNWVTSSNAADQFVCVPRHINRTFHGVLKYPFEDVDCCYSEASDDGNGFGLFD